MNKILQKRIEEAAKDIAELCPDCDLHCKGPNPCIPKILYQKLIEISIFALENQWISVEEALPEKIKDKNYSKYVLTRQEYYEHEYHVIARYDYGFNMWVSTNYFKPEFITHWMEISSLEGGDE